MAQRRGWQNLGLTVGGIAVIALVALIAVIVILLPTGRVTVPESDIDWPLATSYVCVAILGAGVGGTELMSRYHDQPFDAVKSRPGVAYMLVNLVAAILALFLIDYWHVLDGDRVKQILVAGIGSVAIFRSSLFTTKIGGQEVSFGPNLVLKVMLDALDRAYDRSRAYRRSSLIGVMMEGINYANAKKNLPELCFSLMQNVSEAERKTFNDIAKQLEDKSDLSDDVRSLSLGLGLIGIVGDDTLRAAMSNLGSSITTFTKLSDAILVSMAKIKEEVVIGNLLPLCNGLAHRLIRLDIADMTRFQSQIASMSSLSARGRAYLLVFTARQRFGDDLVISALALLPDAIVVPPPPLSTSASAG